MADIEEKLTKGDVHSELPTAQIGSCGKCGPLSELLESGPCRPSNNFGSWWQADFGLPARSGRSVSDPTRSLRWTLVIPESGHSSAVQQLRLGWKAEPGVAPRSGRSDCDLCLPQKIVRKVLNSSCYRLEHYGTSGPFIDYHLLKYRLHPAPKPRRLLSVQLSSGYRSYQPPDVVNHRLTPRRLLQTVPYLWGSGSRWTAC